jgi:hypothetical protein
MTTNSVDALTIRLPANISEKLRAYLADKTGMSVSEVLQLCAFVFYESSRSKDEANDTYRGEIMDMLERRVLAASRDPLLSYRHVLGIQEHTPRAGQILHVIAIHPGNVISTFNPYDPDYIAGSVSLGKEAALRLILSENGHLPPKLTEVMKYRETDSVLSSLEDIVNDEYNLMLMQSSQPKVSQNEYGIVYNKKMNRDGIPR